MCSVWKKVDVVTLGSYLADRKIFKIVLWLIYPMNRHQFIRTYQRKQIFFRIELAADFLYAHVGGHDYKVFQDS